MVICPICSQRISNYKKYKIEKSEDWSELVGAALGDGHIEKYPRTERIRRYNTKIPFPY